MKPEDSTTGLLPANIIVMKVGPHINMSLADIIKTKQEEEVLHGVHYWGYSGVFCQPKPTKEFCSNCVQRTGNPPVLVLIETKSAYNSTVGEVKHYSTDNIDYCQFNYPVQLQGAEFSFVAKNLRTLEGFRMDAYRVVGGKNNGKPLSDHLKFRVNKSFATLDTGTPLHQKNDTECFSVLVADLAEPYNIWLKS